MKHLLQIASIILFFGIAYFVIQAQHDQFAEATAMKPIAKSVSN